MSDKHGIEGARMATFISVRPCDSCGEAAFVILCDEANAPFAYAELGLSTIQHMLTVLTMVREEALRRSQCEGRA
jgi:hypothetical protein